MGTLTFPFSQWTNPVTRPDTACPGQSWPPAAGRACSPGEKGRGREQPRALGRPLLQLQPAGAPSPTARRAAGRHQQRPPPSDAAEGGPAPLTPVGLPTPVTRGSGHLSSSDPTPPTPTRRSHAGLLGKCRVHTPRPQAPRPPGTPCLRGTGNGPFPRVSLSEATTSH